ncbi:A24 family peptidase [Polynucleobacter necessarius]|uniref:A24 family peptidase n=1 Tax=Polynucleobacter necessarius TaxID=576610 RepID=UPI002F941147
MANLQPMANCLMNSAVLLEWIQISLILAIVYLAYIDLRTFRLPDVITFQLILVGLIFNDLTSQSFTPIQDAIIGALLGYCGLWLLNFLYRMLNKNRTALVWAMPNYWQPSGPG